MSSRRIISLITLQQQQASILPAVCPVKFVAVSFLHKATATSLRFASSTFPDDVFSCSSVPHQVFYVAMTRKFELNNFYLTVPVI
jgi:hypothetical protein